MDGATMRLIPFFFFCVSLYFFPICFPSWFTSFFSSYFRINKTEVMMITMKGPTHSPDQTRTPDFWSINTNSKKLDAAQHHYLRLFFSDIHSSMCPQWANMISPLPVPGTLESLLYVQYSSEKNNNSTTDFCYKRGNSLFYVHML